MCEIHLKSKSIVIYQDDNFIFLRFLRSIRFTEFNKRKLKKTNQLILKFLTNLICEDLYSDIRFDFLFDEDF